MLECKKLCKEFSYQPILKNINLKLKKGKIYGLLGPNGSGKSTLIKLMNGLLEPTSGEVLIHGNKPGVESKKVVSYLPERTYLNFNMKVSELITFFEDFYEDFQPEIARELLSRLEIKESSKLKTMSKGTKEKVQLVMVMSRKADLYILDEPIGGVDPAARDYILETILNNFNEEASILISTHLISDIEKILDEVIFIKKGEIILEQETDQLREERGKSVDAIFREEFKC